MINFAPWPYQGVVAMSPISPGLAALAAALSLATSAACAASQGKVTEEVIVEGTRLEIRKRIYDFVTGVTHDGYATESLARWNKRICPMVAGIPRPQGEFVLLRVSEAARAAGARLAGSKCKANFHVVVTSDPDQLVALWRKRAPRLFGGESPTKVRRILSKPRPIRVWYNVWEVCGDGGYAVPQGGDTNFGLATGMSECHINDSRLEWNYTNDISSVIVLVDFDDVQDMKLGPLTDYISMVGLAQVDLDGNWGEVPTVLRLFNDSGDAGSQQMSAWDRAFLKALYTTTQRSHLQRSSITDQMLRTFTTR
jgi:hypothetical protein